MTVVAEAKMESMGLILLVLTDGIVSQIKLLSLPSVLAGLSAGIKIQPWSQGAPSVMKQGIRMEYHHDIVERFKCNLKASLAIRIIGRYI